MGIKVGIDLGTTYSAVAVFDEKKGIPVIVSNQQGDKITPSVIQFMEDGEIIVGSEAKEAFEGGEMGCASAFKRRMGKDEVFCSFYGKDYTSEDLSTILLQYLKQETERVTGQTIDEAVVTVPAYFYHKERQATINAARRAGLNLRQIINEPTAAAMNYGASHWRENARVMVYDLGGGTFDVTLVEMKKDNRMESLQTLGDHSLGGKDWDERLAAIIRSRISEDTGIDAQVDTAVRQAVIRAAESVKRQLSSRNTASVSLMLPGYGRYSTTVTLEEFEAETLDLLTRTTNLCESLLRDVKFTWQDITDILLVGGSTRMRQVSSYLKKISGHTPLCQVNPDEAVALGAAIQVHLPLPEYSVISVGSGQKGKQAADSFRFRRRTGGQQVGRDQAMTDVLSMRQVDVVAHAMGVIAVNQEGTHYINKTIIPANQQIPVKCAESFHYYTSPNGDNEVEIYVLQGVKAPLDCQIIGKYVVSGIHHDRADNPTTIRIQYSYDVNGVIHVQARQGKGTRDLPIREEPVPADMSMYGRPISQEERRSARVEDLSVIMAVDVSGSMDGKPMQDALDAMCHFVDQFTDYPGKVEIGVIAVSDRSEPVRRLTSDLNRCRAAIRTIKCGQTGYCNAAHPFGDILSMMGLRSGKRIGIVLADGMWEHQPAAVAAAKVCHAAGIEIVGIGFGCADKKFMEDISSGDLSAMLVKQSELTQSFGKIAQEIGGGGGGKKGRADGDQVAETWLATNERE